MATFVTDAELKTRVSNVLQFADPSAMPPWWDDVITQANAAAYQDVYTGLIKRGFTIATVNAWDRAKEFQQDQGVFWSLLRGGATGAYGSGWEKLDRRKELELVMVTVNGVWQQPAGQPNPVETPFAQVGFGDVSRSDQMFNQDPNDQRLGQVSVF